MTENRQPRTVADLVPLARAALGPHRRPVAVTRLRGGSKKGVYRLRLDDGGTAIAYVWSPDEDYWALPDADPRDPFSHASGLGLFTAAHDRLTATGVRTPRLLHVAPEAAAAVVEDMTGGSLEDALRRDPEAAGPALRELAESLRALHGCRSAAHGKVAVIDNGGVAYGDACAGVVAGRALSDIAETAVRDPRIAAARERLEDAVRSLADAVRPRTEHSLVHGELGPDHVLLDADGRPVLIDIETPAAVPVRDASEPRRRAVAAGRRGFSRCRTHASDRGVQPGAGAGAGDALTARHRFHGATASAS
ncbi:phosphotransferase [Streptomyces sp. CG1]|uniref:phosphotransferase n=1 Tax=Streptomyces sp. CG1 TaxID=1287523 RepID=UPI0034E23EC6